MSKNFQDYKCAVRNYKKKLKYFINNWKLGIMNMPAAIFGWQGMITGSKSWHQFNQKIPYYLSFNCVWTLLNGIYNKQNSAYNENAQLLIESDLDLNTFLKILFGVRIYNFITHLILLLTHLTLLNLKIEHLKTQVIYTNQCIVKSA